MPYTLSNAPIPGGVGDTFIPAMLSCAGCGSTGTCNCSSSGSTNQASSSEETQTSQTGSVDKLREKAAKNNEILAKAAVATVASAAVTNRASSSEDTQFPKTAFMDKLREKASKNIDTSVKEAAATAASPPVNSPAQVSPPKDLRSWITAPKKPETANLDALSPASPAQLPILELGDQLAQGQPLPLPAISATDTPVPSEIPVPQASNPDTRHHPLASNPWPASESEKSMESEHSNKGDPSHKESDSDPELIEERGK